MKEILTKNWGTDKIDLTDRPGIQVQLKPTELHLKADGATDGQPSLTFVLNYGVYPVAVAQVSVNMLTEALGELGYELKGKEVIQPPSAPSVEGNDTIPDLSGATPEQKAEIINGLVLISARETLKTFMALGLKTHIECRVINDATNDEFIFSFTKVGYKAASTTQGAVWRDADKMPPRRDEPYIIKGAINGCPIVTLAQRNFDDSYPKFYFEHNGFSYLVRENWEYLDETGSQRQAGPGWVEATKDLPETFKVVPCKYTPDSPDPRKDTELHWGFVNKERKWDQGWAHHQVEWLDETGLQTQK